MEEARREIGCAGRTRCEESDKGGSIEEDEKEISLSGAIAHRCWKEGNKSRVYS